MKKVYGDRTCRQCKGICHEKSLRTRWGRRRGYFCSESCLKYWATDRLRKSLKRAGHPRWYDATFTAEEWQRHIESYERVSVIAK